MKKPWSIMSLAAAAAGVLATAVVTGSGAEAPQSTLGAGSGRAPDRHWINTWVSMPQLTEPGNMPPAPFTQDNLVLADSTLRQTIHVSTRRAAGAAALLQRVRRRAAADHRGHRGATGRTGRPA